MNRSISIASMVGGLVLVIGMALLPFSATADSDDGTSSDAETVADCGNLVSHYVSGPEQESCSSPANDRALLAAAGVAAFVGGWVTLRQGGRAV